MEAMPRLEAELTALRAALEESRARRAAQRRAERAEAEAALAGQLLALSRMAPRERDGGSGRRRKAGGPAPSAEEEPGVPATSLNPDGNDGNRN
ncbi:hypothetical protein [Cupriavidus necator]|uniref:hypothetical protein n=1 Tax=Cupriavidus necator TaxID=106590 RepID=UPI0022AAF657|nr:hypothetical protein [Cupriavidus necator]